MRRECKTEGAGAIRSLIRSGSQPPVEAHGEVLIQDNRDIARAGLHLARRPLLDARNSSLADLLKLRYGAIVDGDFVEPRGAVFQFG